MAKPKVANTQKPVSRPPSYPLRLDDELRDRLEAAAQRRGKSLNTEIVERLVMSLLQDEQTETAPELENEQLIRRIAYEVAQQVVKQALANQGQTGD